MTGWPPGLLQDDCRKLSKWFASRPDARYQLRRIFMTDKQPEALRLADWLDALDVLPLDRIQNCVSAADELRRLHNENEALRDGKAFHEGACGAALMENRALRQANEAFAQRQEWWNERMFALEKQRDELLEALRGYVNDYSSEDGMYTEKHYVKVFSEVIDRAEGEEK